MAVIYIDRAVLLWQDGLGAENRPANGPGGGFQTIMRTFLTLFGGLVVTGLVIISVFANFWFGTLLISGQERWLYGAIFGLLDALKTVLVPAAGLAAVAGLFWKARTAYGVRPSYRPIVFGRDRVILNHQERGDRRRQGGPCCL
jgi:hypothetical protein